MGKSQLKKLGKIIEYVLLYRPDEFGVFLNDDGSLPIKDLMWALHEESGWRHIRPVHLKELVYSGLPLAFTLGETCVRPVGAVGHTVSATPQQTLFIAVRRKSYPVILEHGLRPGSRPYVPLATTEDMAFRIGKRRDPKPILLTVHAIKAHNSGHQFYRCGELLYLVESLTPSFFSGPVMPEAPELRKVIRAKPQKTKEPDSLQVAGSFLLDPARDPDLMRRQRRKEDEKRTRQRRQERQGKKRGRRSQKH
jgi:putative RNA 2'-phosphotransferase